LLFLRPYPLSLSFVSPQVIISYQFPPLYYYPFFLFPLFLLLLPTTHPPSHCFPFFFSTEDHMARTKVFTGRQKLRSFSEEWRSSRDSEFYCSAGAFGSLSSAIRKDSAQSYAPKSDTIFQPNRPGRARFLRCIHQGNLHLIFLEASWPREGDPYFLCLTVL